MLPSSSQKNPLIIAQFASTIVAACFLFVTGCSEGGIIETPFGERYDTRDSDDDGISDLDENRAERLDTDGDGQPDYLDDDSDGDGVKDRAEAGDGDTETKPSDADMDGIPDFRDRDSDNNGIEDGDESQEDTDQNGLLDLFDIDDDNDGVIDSVEIANDGIDLDSDKDGTPNWKDPDSDGDKILDGNEVHGIDNDGDGASNHVDLDSDGDGISDLVEAGDDILKTLPIDSDGDLTPDFLDTDSDNDGLLDALEVQIGSDGKSQDGDGDTISDLIEWAAGTDPTDPADNPRARNDFVFVLPFNKAPDPQLDTLEFSTALRQVDLYFGFDFSGSMSEELRALGNADTGVPAMIRELTCEPGEDPSINACIKPTCAPGEDPDVTGCTVDGGIWTGVGKYLDYGTFENLSRLQGDGAATAAAIPTNPSGSTEAQYYAASCVADQSLCGGPAQCVDPAEGLIGCPGFRPDAVKIYMQFSDEGNSCGGSACSSYTGASAGMALKDAGIKFMGLYDGSAAKAVFTEIGVASKSFDAFNEPFVYAAKDEDVVGTAVEAVKNLVGSFFRLEIDVEVADGDEDVLRLIRRISINANGEVAGADGRIRTCTDVQPTEDVSGDGHDDTFTNFQPGKPVCWDVVPAINDFIDPIKTPRVFSAELVVRAGDSVVDQRTVYFLIPPRDVVVCNPC